ncbi:MAG: putative toxin-antitoxin system toxin component, PIN family [Candidatus Dadabacteria bacterium]|nr:putative toxin-antitoxin system toxin component, PIN family [Candidatus Dadabacteria bacterium]
MRVVSDTNVLISGMLWSGNESRLLRRFKTNEVTNLTSPQMLREFEGVISRGKFGLTANEIEFATSLVLAFSMLLHPKERVDVIKKDPADNRILECALDGNADYIISGDGHLLELGEFEGIAIVTAGSFLRNIR